MNTTEINGKEYTLTEGEGGKLTLTPLIKQPEVRTPQAGDVWAWDKWTYIINLELHGVSLDDSSETTIRPFSSGEFNEGATYLGKFSEVYCKIADVRDALSHEDRQGDSIMRSDCIHRSVNASALEMSRNALAKLGIIAK